MEIGVIGPSKKNLPRNKETRGKIRKIAERIGELLAQKSITIITGGIDGVMEFVPKGAKRFDGLTIGTPGNKRNSSNEYIDIEILGEIDEGSFILKGLPRCNAIIAIPGGAGTLAELCMAYRKKIPIVIIMGFDEFYDKLVDGFLDSTKSVKIKGAETPKRAVNLAIKLAKESLLNREKLNNNKKRGK